MLKEMVLEEGRKLVKPALGFGLEPGGESLEQNLKSGSLSEEQIAIVLKEGGRDLARIHAISGEGFGWINPLRAAVTRKFVGTHESWYEFLLAFYDKQTEDLDKIFASERESGLYHAPMSDDNREQMQYLHAQRPEVRKIFEENKILLADTGSNLLHGNVYIGSIFVDHDGTYAGLGDFSQMLVGDPIDDIAYFSVMPEGKLSIDLRNGWRDATEGLDSEEKFHIYRLWESYRKIYTRYAKHRYLDDYPEPLTIAQEEIRNLK